MNRQAKLTALRDLDPDLEFGYNPDDNTYHLIANIEVGRHGGGVLTRHHPPAASPAEAVDTFWRLVETLPDDFFLVTFTDQPRTRYHWRWHPQGYWSMVGRIEDPKTPTAKEVY